MTDAAGYQHAEIHDDHGERSTLPQRRTGWLDRELDYESAPGHVRHKLYDLDHRKYDGAAAQFLSVDPLWPMFLSSGSYVYCTGDAVNKIDPWGLGEKWPINPHPGKTPKAEKKPQTTNNDRDRVDAPDDHERAKTNQDEMKDMFSRSGEWATNEQNRQEHQRGFAVKGGLPFFGARAGGDGFVPRHFNENGLGMSMQRPAPLSPSSVFSVAGVTALSAAAADGPLPLGDVVGLGILASAVVFDATQRVYITYTLRNASGQVYVGRTSGYGDPYTVMMARMTSHHMVRSGFGNPVLDVSAQGYAGYAAIRGREQQLIDYYGGVGSPLVANRIRGVSSQNPLYPAYHAASNSLFGPLAPYSGF